MSLLENLTTDDSIANEKDSVGSGGILESGLYPSTINLAYVIKSDGGATGVVIQAKTDSGRDIKQTLWATSGTAKGGKNFYTDKNGEKQYLPGFIAATALALLTVGKEIHEVSTEVKVVNVYSKEAKAEVPTKVDMLVDLLGQQVIIGLIKQTVDKTTKNESGVYVPTGETREENEIDKFFRAADKLTTSEIRAAANDPVFYSTWENKWAGKVRDKASKANGTTGMPRTGGAGLVGTKKPATSLFA